MACCLQWILDPCQEYSAEALEAVPHIHGDACSTALAKATFWCGENMNTDPKKPQVPPPATLPPKGIGVAMTKALTMEKTSWSKADKLNWYLTNGVEVASGRMDWKELPEKFDQYTRWSLGEEAHPER